MKQAMQILVGPDGSGRCVYDERMDLSALGELTIRRAGSVEPQASGWQADLSVVGGPTLGPFLWRSQAVEAEARWLQEHLDSVGS